MNGAAAGFNRFDMEDREQREEKMRKGRFRLGVLTLFRGLQEKTTSHGLPHVHHARGSLPLCLIVLCFTAQRAQAAAVQQKLSSKHTGLCSFEA